MINIFTTTSIGGRENNQDRYACHKFSTVSPQKSGEVFLTVVMDGMGGHSSGDWYAESGIRFIVSRIAGIIAQADLQVRKSGDDFGVALEKELEAEKDGFFGQINYDLAMDAEKKGIQIGGTTASLCLIYENKAFFLNTGDSPIYRYNEISETAEEIGVRDNQAEALFREGSIERGSDEYYYNSSMLLSFLGKSTESRLSAKIDPHFAIRELSEGDVILLGSDGAFGNEILSADALAVFLSTVPNVRYYHKELLSKASYSTDDNQTLAVIRYVKPADGSSAPSAGGARGAAIGTAQEAQNNAIPQPAKECYQEEKDRETTQKTTRGWLNFGKH